VRQIESSGRQHSDALQATLRGRVTKWFNGQAQYTLGRTYNDTGGLYWYRRTTTTSPVNGRVRTSTGAIDSNCLVEFRHMSWTLASDCRAIRGALLRNDRR